MYEQAWFGATLDEPSQRPGADASMMFVSAYLLEYALAFDNLIVIALLLRRYRVQQAHRPRVLLWGLVAAVVIRFGVMFGATFLGRTFAWALYVFGALVLYSGVRAFWPDPDDENPRDDDALERLLRRAGRIARGDNGARFWVIQNGRVALTALAACVLYGAFVEILFALDSTAVVSVSTTPFVIVTSNILAAIALRGWLAPLDADVAFRVPQKSIAVMLFVAGIKLLLHRHVQVPPVLMLAVIATLIGAAVVESRVASRARSG